MFILFSVRVCPTQKESTAFPAGFDLRVLNSQKYLRDGRRLPQCTSYIANAKSRPASLACEDEPTGREVE